MNFLFGYIFIIYLLIGFNINYDASSFDSSRKIFLETYQQYQAEKELGIKKFNLDITNSGFVRYKRTGINNKAEYFAVRLDKIQDVNYLGDELAGWLIFKCESESVIYQTYNDKNGNIDEMTNEIRFPVKIIKIENINNWVRNFKEMKTDFINTDK
ncbi:hypothetical protein [Pedobacter cryophilus]|uniref:Uncharacterized protein n=1 Tax=Pedobacter cryophilus TaxID=2571271 RepID=A0A4U1C136_9SPHI|nr:hypothetical protein [Pedobacter cryophilus]TKB96757.1 hypothetical protein FA046_11770 [Pedobacter cryophilus]